MVPGLCKLSEILYKTFIFAEMYEVILLIFLVQNVVVLYIILVHKARGKIH